MSRLIRLDRTGHTELASWTVDDSASQERVIEAFRRELDEGMLASATLPDGSIANFYTVQVFNRTGGRLPFEIRAVSPAGATVTSLGLASEVQPHALLEGRLLLAVPPGLLTSTATPVRFDLRVDGGAVQHIDSSFIALEDYLQVTDPEFLEPRESM